MNNNETRGFQYTYSANEQAELKKIREKYMADSKPREISKIEEIHILDASVTRAATVASLCVGIIGTLVMGFGMSLIMTELKNLLGMNASSAMAAGICIGIVGMAAVIIAYPLYQLIAKKQRRRVAPKILSLTEELLEKTN